MASIHPQDNSGSRTYRVKWRDDGRSKSLSFADLVAAEKFKSNIDRYGIAEALRVLEVEEAGHGAVTVTEYLLDHIAGLTGVQAETLNRYRTYVTQDITPVFGGLPLTAVTEHTIAKWIQGMDSSGKTVANKHGFLSGAFNDAVRRGLINANPCQGRRLPHTLIDERVFLTPDEFQLLRSHIKLDRWKNLATWLVFTGMRFSEAAALTPQDIDLQAKTCRINKSWKYSGKRGEMVIGPPKTLKSNRTISLPQNAIDAIGLDQSEYLFTNGAGTPVRAQLFFNKAWKPARDAAIEAGLKKSPRVHDLRHTCASWLIQAGVPLPVIQEQLGHESITTTVAVYGHLDRRSHAVAAAALDAAFNAPKLL